MPSITEEPEALKGKAGIPDVVSLAETNNIRGLEATFVDQQHAVALAAYGKAIFYHPREPSYFLHRAETYLDMGDLNSACSEYYLALQLAPSSKFLQLKLGLTYLTNGQICMDLKQFDRSIRRLKMAMRFLPDDPIPKLCLAITHIRLDNQAAAMKLLGELADAYPKLLAVFIIRAKLHLSHQAVTEAYYDLARVIELTDNKHPEIKAITHHIIEITTVFKNQADEQVQKGHLDIALKLLDYAIEIYPLDESLFLKRAFIYHTLKRYQDAINDYSQIPERDEFVKERQSVLYADYADWLLHKEGNVADALAYITEAIDLGANTSRNCEIKGDCLSALARLEESIECYETAMDVKSAVNKNSTLRVRVGVAYWKQGRQAQALAMLDKAIKLNARNIDAYVERGRFYLESERLDKAKADAEAALAIDFHYGAARILFDQIESQVEQVPTIDFVEGYHLEPKPHVKE